MSSKYKFKDQDQIYFVTLTVVNWIDLFIRDEYREILLDSIQYCQKHKGLEVYAWCLMTSHIHLLIGSQGEPMEYILRDLKRHTSKMLREAIEQHPQESRKEWMMWMMEREGKRRKSAINWQLWQYGNHPQEILDGSMLQQKLNYIHDNPVMAGFVAEPEDYIYSSAIDYSGHKGLLPIIVMDMGGLLG